MVSGVDISLVLYPVPEDLILGTMLLAGVNWPFQAMFGGALGTNTRSGGVASVCFVIVVGADGRCRLITFRDDIIGEHLELDACPQVPASADHVHLDLRLSPDGVRWC